MRHMQVVVIGAGYVGLTTAACIAELGHAVTCADVDISKIAMLDEGNVPIREAGLDALVGRNRAAGRLHFTVDVANAAARADVVLISVGTPRGAGGDADLTHVKAVAREVARAIKPKTVVTIKSTVAVGTARLIREVIAEKRGGLDFWITSNPEFLREGSAVRDFFEPDRIVIGADDPEPAARLTELYRPLIDRGVPLVVTSTVNAELIKYTANAFLALKVGFINDVADLCEEAEADINAVIKGVGLDRRIGPRFLSPGPGFGGSCFPKDTEAFAAAGRKYSCPQPLIETLVMRNQVRKHRLAKKILGELNGLAHARVAVLGIAFKANTDDVRDSAALTIIPLLRAAGVSVSAFDPWARANASRVLKDVAWHEDAYAACSGADLVVILTEWEMFRTLDLSRLSQHMRGSTIFDCRNLMDPQDVASQGFRYVSLGRPAAPRVAPTTAAKSADNRVPLASLRGAAVARRPVR
jgi:UDPglucose 6-dehydrogenase